MNPFVMQKSDIGKLIQDMPYEEYAKAPFLNASILKKMHRSAAHAKAWLDRKDDEESEALLFGSAFHAALLEPKRFKEFLRVAPKVDRRTTIGKQAYAEFMNSVLPTDIVISEEWMEQITGMLDSISSHPLAAPLLETGVREACLFWSDPKTGIDCKARFDFITADGIALDVKTTRDAHPERASREIFSEDRLYWLQAAHYASGAKATKVCSWDSFNFLFIEKEPPYALCVKVLEGPDLEASMQHRDYLVRRYKEVLDTHFWPSYAPEPTLATVGNWFLERYSREEK